MIIQPLKCVFYLHSIFVHVAAAVDTDLYPEVARVRTVIQILPRLFCLCSTTLPLTSITMCFSAGDSLPGRLCFYATSGLLYLALCIYKNFGSEALPTPPYKPIIRGESLQRYLRRLTRDGDEYNIIVTNLDHYKHRFIGDSDLVIATAYVSFPSLRGAFIPIGKKFCIVFYRVSPPEGWFPSSRSASGLNTKLKKVIRSAVVPTQQAQLGTFLGDLDSSSTPANTPTPASSFPVFDVKKKIPRLDWISELKGDHPSRMVYKG